ncbi:alpha-L-arabinofuranosidase C-terminal domain-containing protein [Marinoscillum sp. MHG1-6]|uniref:alpha-L-arabinofuranosidase C-terminal domain-containing protein n=1 Tax=Marinoscillum sp. MHG1-6 TaxID=2959627 RepID=UPI002157EB06|nr:alpha-L-arabinofuranosidase C-terminal domain-containing protein [Marinoscillum sp. MHG1-6]
MKKLHKIVFALLILFSFNGQAQYRGPADSVYLFAYSRDEGKSGLLLAWSRDQVSWYGIGPHQRFLFSDFGRWGSQKRMHNPYLFQDEQGTWHCVWSLNKEITQLAHASSADLIKWIPQVYPDVMTGGDINDPAIEAVGDGQYQISWYSNKEEGKSYYQTTTSDFKAFSTTKRLEQAAKEERIEANVDGTVYRGMIHKVSWETVEKLIQQAEWEQFHENQRQERLKDDPIRFGDLQPVNIEVSLQPENEKAISNELMGIFFEDINYAADGGLYAELIQNRDFEYHPSDKRGRDKEWNSYWSWSYEGDKYGFEIDSLNPIHPNNSHYAVINGKPNGSGLVNEGWDGIVLSKGEKYDFSIYAKSLDKTGKSIIVRLTGKDGSGNYGQTTIKKIGAQWKSYPSVITATDDLVDGRLEIIPQQNGKLALDMISLFPRNTFNGRKNGLRKDLAKVITDLNPQFVRFPGGCVAHGDGLGNIYRWKNSIGPLEARTPMRNLWGYHQTLGLGYYEYFQFCEDIGAEPVPVLAAGVPCQNSGVGGHGQCGGIPMNEMDEYVQDILDLIEWANGDKSTKWGKVRAAAGHPKPFNMKYIGIGNEDLITDLFQERFEMIYKAVKAKYPEIIVIGTVGPFYRGTDYEHGWEFARELDVEMVDEHYYQPPGWFINNQNYYDKYDRKGPKVYLGEYAAHVPNRRMNIETSLAEALYLINVERNADVVTMTSFAPLLAKDGHHNWTPDLIYFNNTEINLTTDYFVQKLFGQHSGNYYVPTTVSHSNQSQEVKKRIAISVVKDENSEDLIVKMVNLLPVATNAKVDLSSIGVEPQQSPIYILTGKPDDEGIAPKETVIDVSDNLEYTMEPYSFNVFRVKTK